MALELNDEIGRDAGPRRNIVAYTRTYFGKDGPSVSLERQIAAAEAWCAANGGVLVATMTKETRSLETFVREIRRLRAEGITVDEVWPGCVL